MDVPVGTSVIKTDDDGDGLIEYLPGSGVGRIDDSVDDCDDDGECLERKNRELCEQAFVNVGTKREAQEQLKRSDDCVDCTSERIQPLGNRQSLLRSIKIKSGMGQWRQSFKKPPLTQSVPAIYTPKG